MNTVLIDLKTLQELDDRLKAGREAAEAGERRLKAAGIKLHEYENKLARTTEDLAVGRARHLELEEEVRNLSARQRNNEARRLNVKNQNEEAALSREAEFLAEKVGSIEDEILELLDKIEKAEVEKADLEMLVTEESALYGATAAEVEAAAALGAEDEAALTARRAAVAGNLPAERLRQYEETVKNRAGRGVAPAADGMCLACSLGFPPQLFNELQRNEKIVVCPNCGRILFWRDHPDFKSDK